MIRLTYCKLLASVPLMIGGGALLIVLDVIVAAYRAIGFDKGTAVYLALVTIIVVASLLIRRRVRVATVPRGVPTNDIQNDQIIENRS